jgi:hypothetical protein
MLQASHLPKVGEKYSEQYRRGNEAKIDSAMKGIYTPHSKKECSIDLSELVSTAKRTSWVSSTAASEVAHYSDVLFRRILEDRNCWQDAEKSKFSICCKVQNLLVREKHTGPGIRKRRTIYFFRRFVYFLFALTINLLWAATFFLFTKLLTFWRQFLFSFITSFQHGPFSFFLGFSFSYAQSSTEMWYLPFGAAGTVGMFWPTQRLENEPHSHILKDDPADVPLGEMPFRFDAILDLSQWECLQFSWQAPVGNVTYQGICMAVATPDPVDLKVGLAKQCFMPLDFNPVAEIAMELDIEADPSGKGQYLSWQ